MPPVFLHSGWRTGSTYLWTKFRRQQSCMAFYEPFNEMLSAMSPVNVYLARHDLEAMNHSEIGQPYFHEYLPLLGQKGLALFSPDFSYKNYFVIDQDLPDQRAYIASLIQLAEKTHKAAVFGFVRSLGRVAWFRRQFPHSVNLVALRSPLAQWLSGRDMALKHGQEFLDPMQLLILSQACGSAALVDQAKRLGVPRLEQQPFSAVKRLMLESVATLGPGVRFKLFAWLHAFSYLAAIPHADLVIDMDRLSADTNYQAETASALRRISGYDLDFADARIPRHVEPDLVSALMPALDEIRQELASGRFPLPHPDIAADKADAARVLLLRKLDEDRELLAPSPSKPAARLSPDPA
jgi:hypothetical protein